MTLTSARSALDEPQQPATGRWISYWTMSIFGAFLAYYASQQILLPRHANAIAGGDSALAVSITSYAGMAASLVAIIVSVLVGVLSDRTLHSRGRRQIWVISGAILAGGAYFVQGMQTTMLGLVIAWSVFQIGYNCLLTSLLAAVPDEVPVNQRATVSGMQAVAQAVGPLAGIAMVGVLLTGIFNAYAGLGIAVILLAIPFALRTRGVRLTAAERPPLNPRELLSGLVSPFKHRDFAWAFGQRFMIQLSNAFGLLFMYQYLKDAVRVDPDTTTLVVTFIYTVAVCAVAVPAGRISDRTLKRKRMVFLASFCVGVAGVSMAFWYTLPSTIVGAVLLGVGIGCYQAVDQALVTQVLPKAEHRGKDLGVIQIANVLPYVFGSALAGVLINSLGGFTTLYLAMVVTGVASAFLVMPIKSVR
ncbi:MFS transporter [Nonomuraea sp. NPDC003201]